MKINTENLFATARIEIAVEVVLKNATQEILELINNTPIIITTDHESIEHHYYLVFAVLDKLAVAQIYHNIILPKIDSKNGQNLIVLNFEKIEKLNLNDNEIAAIIAHELGHLFNKYPVEEIPPLGNNIRLEDQKAIKRKNRINKEFNADNFVRRLKLEKYLISSLSKVIYMSKSSYHSEIIARINNLNSPKQFLNPNQLFIRGLAEYESESIIKRLPREEKIFQKKIKKKRNFGNICTQQVLSLNQK